LSVGGVIGLSDTYGTGHYLFEILSYHSPEYGEYGRLGCDAV